ncbi:mucin-1 [Pungitius pungitius]|uniref:mucin-1 n=1 Tax=Pungitius pungitius TaxID=134920 RepID=UPI002E0E2F32
MQLHACLLLFIITTDKTLALPDHPCGGHVALGKQPAGLVHLSSPGPSTAADHRSPAVSACTWTIGVPPGRRVLLTLVRSDGGSGAVSCAAGEGSRVLESGGTVVLSGCDGHEATFTLTGAGRPSSGVQLSYYVQEDERNSSGDRTGPGSDRDLRPWSPTGASFTGASPVGQRVARGTDGGRLFEGPRGSPGLSPSSRDEGPLHPTPPPRGPTLPGRADRETLPLPEEAPNNGADTSGAARRGDGKMAAAGRARPGFQRADPLSGTANTRSGSSHQLATSRAVLGMYVQKYTAGVHLLGSAWPPGATWEGGASGLGLGHSWRTRQSTDTDLTSAVTSGPREPPGEFRQGDSRADAAPTTSSGRAPVAELETEAVSFHPNARGTDSSAAPEVARQSAAVESSDELATLRTFTGSTGSRTNPPQSTGGPAPDVVAAAQTSAPSGTTGGAGAPTLPPTYTLLRDRWPANPLFPASTRPSTALPGHSHLTHAPFALPSSAEPPTLNTQDRVPWTFSTTSPVRLEQPRNLIPTAPTSVLSPPTARTHSGHGGEEVEEVEREGDSPSVRTTSTPTTGPSSTGPPSPGPPSTGPSSMWPSSTGPPSTGPPSTRPPSTWPPSTWPSSTGPPSTGPPSTGPSSTGPSSTRPPSTRPPSTGPPSTGPPSTGPPSTRPPSTGPPSTGPPSTRPPSTWPSSTGPPSTGPPSTGPSSTGPSSTRPPSTRPPSTGPLSTRPPSTGPPSTGPPSTGPPSTRPPSTRPPSTGPPSTGPPSTRPPSTGPSSTGPSSTGPPSWTASHPGQEPRSTLTPPALTFAWSHAATQTPDFYMVPDQPAAIRVESVELLLQIVVEDSRSAFASGLEEDAAAWVELYLRKAPGFSELLGVWSSGHAVQSLVRFRTSGALRWLGAAGPASLLERTGLAQAAREGRSFHSSKITNITLGGVQGDVCDWLLQCPEGYECVFSPGTANYSCSSRCHFDYCHHRGICTHHPGQLPVCRCLVGEDFWFMGRRCDVRMTRARLVGACLAVLLVMVALIGVLALVAVRRYRAILIQAKVDQTRSSYRRFNHFDELSGRFWLRSWAGSADSLDNPAFTRSDELLHLRALDRPCCYHDDTLSLASTCPSHGARINTIYPHSSQYGWRGSEVSMADGVLDSGKASDLSVCSWPVEPIQWTPFPLLQQLASHRTPAARVSRPRSYCEGMELADLGKSWTA